MNKPVLVIMAAGLGSRFGGVKQAEAMTNEGDMLIDFALFNAKRAGFDKAIIIIREEHRVLFREHIDERAGKVMDIEYVYQKMDDIPPNGFIPEGRKKPWGTAHAIYACRNVIDGPFAVINADDYYGPSGFHIAYEACMNNHAALIGYRLYNAVPEKGAVTRGICETNGQWLSMINEQKNVEKRGREIGYTDERGWHRLHSNIIVSMNFWAFPKEWIDELPERFERFFDTEVKEDPMTAEFLIPKVIGEMVSKEGYKVMVLPCNEIWCGVTSQEDKEWVQETIASMRDEELYPKYLWE